MAAWEAAFASGQLWAPLGKGIRDIGAGFGEAQRNEQLRQQFNIPLDALLGQQPQQQGTLASLGQMPQSPMQQPAPTGLAALAMPEGATPSDLPLPPVRPSNLGVSEAGKPIAQGFANEFGSKWAASAPKPQASQQAANFPASLIRTESGGRWNAQNDVTGAGGMKGHFGRLQFGQARLQEAMAAGAIPAGVTPQAFMASPELQQRAEQWHFADIDNFIQQRGLDRAIGQQVNGVPITLDGMRAVAHLGGKGGLEQFIKTGGRYNPADANGTSLMSYLAQHGGQGQGANNPLANVAPMQQGQGQPMQVAQAGGGFPVQQGPQQQQNPFPPGMTLGDLLANPATRQIGQQILTSRVARDPMQQQLQGLQIQQLQQTLQGGSPQQQAMAAEQLRQIQLGNQKTAAEISGEGRKPITIKEGETLLDPVTRQPIYTGAQKAGEFQKTLDKKSGEMFSGLLEQKTQIESDLADIGTLRQILPNVPTGFIGRKVAQGANLAGISSEAGANLQQFEAIVNRLVPSQRQPGSGQMSDRDVELFKSSLPSLTGTPEGNRRIIATMEGMAQYKSAQTQIAEAVATGRMSQQDGIKALQAIPNPLSWVRGQNGAKQAPAPSGNQPAPPKAPPIASKAQYDSLPSGTQFTAPDGSVRVKP